MKVFVALFATLACASAGLVAPATTLLRAPSHDSAVIQSHRFGGNFAYRTDEAHAYASIQPVVSTVRKAVGVSYTQGAPIVKATTVEHPVTYAAAPAITSYAAAPAITSYAAAPAITSYAAAPAITSYAAAPAITSYAAAPAITSYAAAPAITSYAAAPAITSYAAAPAITSYAAAPAITSYAAAPAITSYAAAPAYGYSGLAYPSSGLAYNTYGPDLPLSFEEAEEVEAEAEPAVVAAE